MMLKNEPLQKCVNAGESPKSVFLKYPRAGHVSLTCSILYIVQFRRSLGLTHGDSKVRLHFSSSLRLQ